MLLLLHLDHIVFIATRVCVVTCCMNYAIVVVVIMDDEITNHQQHTVHRCLVDHKYKLYTCNFTSLYNKQCDPFRSCGGDSALFVSNGKCSNNGVGTPFVVMHTSSKYFDYQSKFCLFAPMSHCKVIFSIENSYAPLQCIS